MKKIISLVAVVALVWFVVRMIQVEHQRREREEALKRPGAIQLSPMEAMPMTVVAQPPARGGSKALNAGHGNGNTNHNNLLTPQEKQRLSLTLPSLDVVRKEVSVNPHITPPALVKFAGELGPKMDEAMTSETKAQYLFGELGKCAAATDGAQSAQALCLQDAHRLEAKFGSLHSEYENIKSKAAPDVVNLAKTLGD